MTRAALLLLFLAIAVPAHAETYRVDLIVFRNLWGTDAGEKPAAPRAPDLRNAFDPSDKEGLERAGIHLLPDAEFGMQPEWASLRSSKQFKPLVRLSWLQDDPPEDRGPGLLIRSGAKMTVTDAGGFGAHEVSEVDGKVTLLASHFLHLDVDLQYTEAGTDPVAVWPLVETRKLRRDELHHLDSPKLGVLVRVTRPAPVTPTP